MNCFFIFGSMLFYIFLYYIGCLFSFVGVSGLFYAYFGSFDFWLTSIIAVCITYLLSIAYLRYKELMRKINKPQMDGSVIETERLLDLNAQEVSTSRKGDLKLHVDSPEHK